MKNPIVTIVREIPFNATYRLSTEESSLLKEGKYVLQIGIFGPVDYSSGVVFCKKTMDLFLEKMKKKLDGNNLNTVDELLFPSDTPTTELLCVWFSTQLMDFMEPGQGVQPSFVRLYDSFEGYAEIKFV